MTIEECERALEEWHRMEHIYRVFFDLCKKHLVHARTKHPQFAKRVLWRSSPLANDHFATEFRRNIPLRGYALEDILMSEVHEFLVEADKGDMERAIEEAADIVAVLIRAIAGDMENEDNND